jgi:hypothetical protein
VGGPFVAPGFAGIGRGRGRPGDLDHLTIHIITT